MKVYNQERRTRSDSVAAKEYRLLKELEDEKHTVKPIYLFEKGDISFKHPRTGLIKKFSDREMVMMELCPKGDLFDLVSKSGALIEQDELLVRTFR